MPPPRVLRDINTKTALMPLARKGISTRSKNTIVLDQNIDPAKRNGKRKADGSPIRNDKIKRSALGNLTNAVVQKAGGDDENCKKNLGHKVVPLKKTLTNMTNQVLKLVTQDRQISAFPAPAALPAHRPAKVMTRAAARANSIPKQVSNTTAVKPKTTTAEVITVAKPTTRRISNDFEKAEESLYMSALEDL